MNISSYSDLLSAAKSQPEPQRLLFAFAKAELPANAGADERERFAAKQGGALSPVMCVDKSVLDLNRFEDLVEESRQTGAHWDIVFVTTMSDHKGPALTHGPTEVALKSMVESIRNGQIANFLAFNREGELVQFR